MRRPDRKRKAPILVETLEGRSLPGAGVGSLPALVRSAMVGPIKASAFPFKSDSAGVAAITSALRGGPGSEWVNLVKRQVRNYLGVVSKFVTGQITKFSTPGAAFQLAGFQSQYTGPKYDQLSVIAGGAGLIKGKTLELGGIFRGPFHNPDTSYYVFGIDRGMGSKLGPTFSSIPGIHPDALVTLKVGPFGSSASGTVTDLTNGLTSGIDPSKIQIKGATLRAYVSTALLPSTGFKLQNYKYALWTQTQPGNDVTTVASLIPATGMNQVGILSR